MDFIFDPPPLKPKEDEPLKVEVKSRFVTNQDVAEVKRVDEHGILIKAKESLADRLQKQVNPTAIIKPPSSRIITIEPEFEIHENPRFMKDIRRVELKHKDHSGMFIAKRCLREYFYVEVLGMVLPENVNVYLPWGTAYHLFKQRLNEEYGYGDKTPKVYDPDKAMNAFKIASFEGLKYWDKYGLEQKPGTELDWFTKQRFIASMMKGYEHWVGERRRGLIKIIAIEQFFIVQLSDGRFVQGRIDEVVQWLGDYWIRDTKTTSKDRKFFQRILKPNNQVRTYTFGGTKLRDGPVKGTIFSVMYNGKTTKQGDKGPEVFEEPVECDKDELKQWEKEQVHWNNELQRCREEDVWPQSEVNCSYCKYHQVCQQTTEGAQMYVLQTKYVQRVRNPAVVIDD